MKVVDQRNQFSVSEYDLKITTGSSIGAGTDAHVYIKIIGTEGTTTEHELVGSGDTFERGRSVICSFLFL